MAWYEIAQLAMLAVFVFVVGIVPFCLVMFDGPTDYSNDPW